MTRYKNLSNDSGVLAYETGAEFITVKFQDGIRYTYTYASAGKRNVEAMKKYAAAGKGLSTFISQTVREKYESKE